MKKRKVKLFASIASLAMVVAVMGVGVWAASQQSVNVSSTVQFTATTIAADVKLAVSGTAVETGTTVQDGPAVSTYKVANTSSELAAAEVQDLTASAIELASFALTDPVQAKAASLDIVLTDIDNAGYVATTQSIVYTFTIDPTAGTAGIFYQIEMSNANTETFNITMKINNVEAQFTDDVYQSTQALTYVEAGGDEATIAITFTPKNNIVSSIAADTKLADFQIDLRNTTYVGQ